MIIFALVCSYAGLVYVVEKFFVPWISNRQNRKKAEEIRKEMSLSLQFVETSIN